MVVNIIDGLDLARMLRSGAALLEKNKNKVDSLNVFPVPDGDTGTNMYLTLLSASREVEKRQDTSIGKVGKAISMGSLMGARGNSGVILSQVFRGIAKELESKDGVDSKGLAAALQAGSDAAYKAVMKPVEGTILTVVREVAGAAVSSAKKSDDIIKVMLTALESGKRTLEKTPQMLPILKEAGVVDAGGQGFLFLFEGMITALSGGDVEAIETFGSETESKGISLGEELEYAYCTETLIRGRSIDQHQIRKVLEPMGDSMLVVGEDDLVKVHIHSNNPGKILEILIGFGTLHDIKINNMEDEAREKVFKESVAKTTGVVAVSQGEGWSTILSSLGVDELVSGGQTMNPSTEDLLKAIESVKADGVIVLPNNRNIIMAAEQAAGLADRPVKVVPTTSVTQAVAAMVGYEKDLGLEELSETMIKDMERVRTGEVTVAIKDSSINGFSIKQGDFIGLIDDKIVQQDVNAGNTVHQLLDKLADQGDLISIYYGLDVSLPEAELLREEVESRFPDFDVELHFGGQPFYHYLVSVE